MRGLDLKSVELFCAGKALGLLTNADLSWMEAHPPSL